MPFKSQAQRAYMHINHPKIADRWEKEGKRKAILRRLKDNDNTKAHN